MWIRGWRDSSTCLIQNLLSEVVAWRYEACIHNLTAGVISKILKPHLGLGKWFQWGLVTEPDIPLSLELQVFVLLSYLRSMSDFPSSVITISISIYSKGRAMISEACCAHFLPTGWESENRISNLPSNWLSQVFFSNTPPAHAIMTSQGREHWS